MDIRVFQGVEAGKSNLTLTTLARLCEGFKVDPIELATAVATPKVKRTPGRPKRS